MSDKLPAKLMRIPKFKEWDGEQVSPVAWEIRCDLISDKRMGYVMACLWYITDDHQQIKFMRNFTPLEAAKNGFVDRFMRVDAYQKSGDLPKHWKHPALITP